MSRTSSARSREKMDRTKYLIINGASDQYMCENSVYAQTDYDGKTDDLSGKPMYTSRLDSLRWIAKAYKAWMKHDKGWAIRNSFTKEVTMRSLKEQQFRLNSVIKNLMEAGDYQSYVYCERALTEVIVQYERIGSKPKIYEVKNRMDVRKLLPAEIATEVIVSDSSG